MVAMPFTHLSSLVFIAFATSPDTVFRNELIVSSGAIFSGEVFSGEVHKR